MKTTRLEKKLLENDQLMAVNAPPRPRREVATVVRRRVPLRRPLPVRVNVDAVDIVGELEVG